MRGTRRAVRVHARAASRAVVDLEIGRGDERSCAKGPPAPRSGTILDEGMADLSGTEELLRRPLAHNERLRALNAQLGAGERCSTRLGFGLRAQARVAAAGRSNLEAAATACAAAAAGENNDPKMGRVDVSKLKHFVSSLLRGQGSAPAEAETVADHLVMANLKGHDSHGVGMLPQYFNSIQRGLLKPNQPLTKVSDTGPMLVFDAGQGYGQRAAHEALLLGAERAKLHGVCVYALRRASHIGRVGTYAEMAAARGLVYTSWTNVGDHAPLVAPDGGTQARFGTNPVTMGTPKTKRNPAVILDMATSVVALGKVRVNFNKQLQMDEGALINGDGEPTTDPSVMFGATGTDGTAAVPTGALRAFGDHKGAGLALMCELLAGAIGGGGTIQPENERTDHIINNKVVVLFDPTQLTNESDIEKESDAMLEYVRSTPAARGKQVLVAGEPEIRSEQERRLNGVPIDSNTWAQLCQLANDDGSVSPPDVDFV